jgi:hypothetical protein
MIARDGGLDHAGTVRICTGGHGKEHVARMLSDYGKRSRWNRRCAGSTTAFTKMAGNSLAHY